MKGPKPSTRAIALCAELGVELIDQERPGACSWSGEPLDGGFEAWSPAGSVFAASGCHVLICPWPFGMPTDTAWSGFLEQLQAGLKACEEKDCEECEVAPEAKS